MAASDVVIAGSATMPFGRHDDGPRDWIRRVARAALDDAGLGPADVDAVVVASESDCFTLQLTPGALLVDEMGLVPCPVMRVEMGGASGAMAVRAGFMHVRSGLHRCVLVVGFDAVASGLRGADVRMLYGLSFDADLDGMAGATAANHYALSASTYLAWSGATPEDFAAVAVRMRANGRANALAHDPREVTVEEVLASPMVSSPYRRLDCSRLSDGAAAVVLTGSGFAGRSDAPRVRIAGSGCASDAVRPADRDEPHRFAGKARAASEAYAMARLDDPPRQVDVVEAYDAFSGALLQALEALGLSRAREAAGDWHAGRYAPDGAQAVNVSGGLIGQGGCPGATGIAQVVAVARILQGRFESPLQPTRKLRRGIAEAHSGMATVNVVHVLERMP